MKNRGKPILFGLLFMVFNLVMVFIFGQITELTCSKSESNIVTCNAARNLLGILSISTRQFTDISNASVVSSCDDEGCTYRIVFATSKGSEPMTNYFSSGETKKVKIAREINDYIGSTSQTEELKLQDNSGLWAALMSFGFSLFGLYLIIVKGIFGPKSDQTT